MTIESFVEEIIENSGILKDFEDINFHYNDCTKYDILKKDLELLVRNILEQYSDIQFDYEDI